MNPKEFEKRIDALVTELETAIKEVDPIYLMSLLNQKAIHSVNFPETSSDLPDGFVQKFHYICGLAVVKSQAGSKVEEQDDSALEPIFTIVDTIFKEYTYLWITRPSLRGSREREKVREYEAGLTSFLGSLHQPKLGSSEQFIQFTRDHFEPFDDKFVVPEIGASTNQIIDITFAITEILRDQYEAFAKDFADIMAPLRDIWNQLREGKTTLEESIQRASQNPIPEVRLTENMRRFYQSFVVSKKELSNRFPETILDAFFESFGFEPGGINKGFRYPTDLNELDFKPFMQVEADRYYVTEALRLFPVLSTALQRLISESEHAESYFKHRDELSQRKTVELLGKVFPPTKIIEEAYYGYANEREFETDILIPYGRTILICEVKSKALRDPLHTEGNINKIKKDFAVSVQAAFSQALRTHRYILSREKASFVDKKKRQLAVLNREDFDNHLLMVVTAEPFGSLGTNLSILLEKQKEEPYPLVISLFDLELLVTRLDTPAKLFDYISQRILLHGHVYGGDELEFAGYYLEHGNLDFDEITREGGMAVLDSHYAEIFDEDWFKARGIKIGKEKDEGGPYKTLLRRKGDQITVGVEGLPETFETFHLGKGASVKDTPRKMKGRDRNAPCPCGSGKKYKKCCGSSGGSRS